MPDRSPKDSTRRFVRLLWIVLLALLAIAATGFVVWELTPLGPSESAIRALSGNGAVTVTARAWGWEFTPASAEPTVGLVFYPGGHVDARSYSTVASAIARRGYTVALVRVPLSLAVLSPNAAKRPIDEIVSVKRWAVTGHSLGGVAASGYAAKNSSRISGLMLLASYPIDDLSAKRVSVVDVTGTSDGVLDQQRWSDSHRLLPATTDYVSIEGGNHAGFGDYGPQPGDNAAGIPVEAQHKQIADAAEALLATIAARK
jgi:predicted alpha/beta-hydrolase family hydrolase